MKGLSTKHVRGGGVCNSETEVTVSAELAGRVGSPITGEPHDGSAR